MSVYSGPELIDDSLVLLLDSHVSKSYPGSGNTWYDLSMKKNNATATTLAASNDTYGSAISLDLSSQIDLSFAQQINKYSFTFIYWGRPIATPNSNYQLIWRLNHTTSGISYFIGDTREVATPSILHYVKDFATNNWDTRIMINQAEYVNYNWHHYALVMSSENNWKSYVDGQLLGTNTTPNQDLSGYGNINALILGGSSCNFHLSKVCMYARPLSDEEIKINFNAYRSRYGI